MAAWFILLSIQTGLVFCKTLSLGTIFFLWLYHTTSYAIWYEMCTQKINDKIKIHGKWIRMIARAVNRSSSQEFINLIWWPIRWWNNKHFSQDDSKSAKTNMHRKRNREIIILSKQFSSSDFRRQKIDLYLFCITFGVQNISYQW